MTSEDFALLDQWRAGDRTAGNQLLQKHFDSLYRFADQFLPGYYGGAAPQLRAYIDLLHAEVEASGEVELGIEETTAFRLTAKSSSGDAVNHAEHIVRVSPFRNPRIEDLFPRESWPPSPTTGDVDGDGLVDIVTNEMTWADEVYRIFGFLPQSISPTLSDYLEYIHN